MTKYYVGLDISMKKTYTVILNDKGGIVRQKEVVTDPQIIADFIEDKEQSILCLESGSISHFLAKSLQSLGFDVVMADARHMAGFLASRVNKNDKNDAYGIAQALRADIVKPVAIKSDAAQDQQVLISSRRQLCKIRQNVRLCIRGQLKSIGVCLPERLSTSTLIEHISLHRSGLGSYARESLDALCSTLQSIEKDLKRLDEQLHALAKEDSQAKLLQTIPGVGPVTAITYLTTMDAPSRFKRSRNVGAYMGLTPRQYASGEVNRMGRISHCGPAECRSMLYEAAMSLLVRNKKSSHLKSWGLRLRKKKGLKKAVTAVARRLAVIMHQMLVTGEVFDSKRSPLAA